MELLHKSGEVINQKYRILDTLGKGGIGITYLAEDLETNKHLALKVLSLRRINDWKKIELFERESQILSQLHHPAIPHYFDYFKIETDNDSSFYIAQQLAPGKSLEELIESGWNPKESEVKDIAIEILDILIYLHSFSPPIIHRDIKPQNIIRNENGKIFLVDFGAVTDTYHNTIAGGSTVVGTFGYMAPEQFRGKALPATDLYGLGTTLLYLLTKKSPSDLPQKHLKIEFCSQVNISRNFADWLNKIIEPIAEERFADSGIALAVLQGKESVDKYLIQKSRKPKDTPISLQKNEETLQIDIPPGKFRDKFRLVLAMIILLATILLFLILLVIAQSFFWGNILYSLGGCCILFVWLIFGLVTFEHFVITPLSHIKFSIFKYQHQYLFSFQKHLLFCRILNVRGEIYQKIFRNTLNLIQFHLTPKEYRWIKAEINNFINNNIPK